MITSPLKPKTVGLAAAAGQTQTDNRFGPRVVAPLQRNAATTPYKTSIRPQLTQLQKSMTRPISAPQPIQPVTAPNTNQSANGTPLNQTQSPIPMPQYRPRPQFDPNAVNGAITAPQPEISVARGPNGEMPQVPNMVAKPATGGPGTGGAGGMGNETSVPVPATPVAPAAPAGNPAWTTGAPQPGTYNATGIGAPGTADYQYTPPPIDPRVQGTLDRLNQGTNINVVGAPPTNPGRFDTLANQFNPNVTGQVGSEMGNFNPNITSAGSNFQIQEPGARNASFFDRATSEFGTNVPTAPGQVGGIANPSTVGREGGIGQSEAERQATEAQLKVANAAAANGGMLSQDQMNALMEPYIRAAQSQAAEASGRGNALLAKASGGAGLDTQSVADVARQSSQAANEMIGTKFSDIMQQNLAGRAGLLSAASGALSDVGGREAGKSVSGAQLGVEQRGQDVTQRAQDIESSLTQRTQNIGQRAQDMDFLSKNADRLSNEMLGLAGLDIKKYTEDGSLNVEKYKADITRQMQDRGLSLSEAQAKTDQYFKALDATMGMTQSERQNQLQMAELSQRADQGDTQAMLQHSNLLLQQAVSSGQLSNDQANMLLNNLYNYWTDPQKMQLAWNQIKEAATARTYRQGGINSWMPQVGNFVSNIKPNINVGGGG